MKTTINNKLSPNSSLLFMPQLKMLTNHKYNSSTVLMGSKLDKSHQEILILTRVRAILYSRMETIFSILEPMEL
jgi:hypothetical protein